MLLQELPVPAWLSRLAQAAPRAAVPSAAPSGPGSAWTEHTAPDGRKYYYNAGTKQSVWTKPVELQTPEAALKAVEAARSGAKAGVFVAQPGSIQTGPTPHHATTAEAKDAFKALLNETGVSSTNSWDEVSRAIMADKRFGSLKTLGERKAAFNEFVQQRRKEEAEAARAARMAAKEGFYELLDGCRALDALPKFSRARDELELDPRWLAVASAREREELFEDWVEERARAEKERHRLERKRAQNALRDLLEGASWLVAGTPWRRAQDRLAGVPEFEAVDAAGRLEVFREVMEEVEKREKEAAARAREELVRSERANRAAFRELLADLRARGAVHARSRWREALALVEAEPAYLAVERNTTGSRPRELFEDLLEDMEKAYLEDRAEIKAVVAERGLVVDIDSKLEDFLAALGRAAPAEAAPAGKDGAAADGMDRGDGEGKDVSAGEVTVAQGAQALGAGAEPALPDSIPTQSLQLYFVEQQGLARDEIAKREKEHRYQREDFSRLLRHERRIEAETPWEDAVQLLEKEPEWKELESLEEKRELFDAFIAKLKAKEAERAERKKSRRDDDRSDDERRDRKRHKHKKDRKRHHGDSEDERDGKRDRRSRDRSRSESQRRSMEECRVVILGAEMEALQLVSLLPRSLQQQCMVLDHAGSWLSRWTTAWRGLGIQHLRSPVTHHPGPEPGAFSAWIEKQGRSGELLEAVPGYSPLPTARLLEDYCLSKVVKALPPCLQRIRQDTLERVEPTPYQGTASESDGCLFNSRPDSLFLDACQVTHLPPLSFMFDPGGLTLHLGSGAEVLTRALVVSRVDSRPLIPPWAADLVDREGTAVRSAHRLRLAEEELAGRSVAVVGGGMTSVTLALAAAARGARAVTLVARRPLRQAPFEVGVGWQGPKLMVPFAGQPDPATRLAACRAARAGATINGPAWEVLAAAVRRGDVAVREGRTVERVAREGDAGGGLEVRLEATRGLHGACASALPASDPSPGSNEGESLTVDEVWVACGAATVPADSAPFTVLDALSLPGGLFVGGYPRCDDASLVLPGAPVYVLGRTAMLACGPTAGTLGGNREAAKRVAASLARLDMAGEKAWHAAAGKLQAAPAPRLELLPPPEAEGAMWQAPRKKVPVAREPDRIDVSDLPPNLPRKELGQYRMIDEGFDLTLVLQLEEPVTKDQVLRVRTAFDWQSLEVWAVGQIQAFHLHVPKLWGRILPGKCGIKVNVRTKKLFVCLYKETDAEWRYLKGF
ncbi:Pre-mRNA-processing factor 40-like protein A [Auxenochlorella protothecoides]|uniref:Pre-mRNA-processing factor 40-like protein A n=1 Tax=Auxenochlorella protothecoides TaxID=3075 RepID=A0A087SDN9_AUXPR|nr:Pre-mRNA-processing factor 40-like protein A [Auxenochlorella protothecoides]KFM23843.1 Pre-mRNA-processing factor 40-like protein A [Auxenochlorella protothecoides]